LLSSYIVLPLSLGKMLLWFALVVVVLSQVTLKNELQATLDGATRSLGELKAAASREREALEEAFTSERLVRGAASVVFWQCTIPKLNSLPKRADLCVLLVNLTSPCISPPTLCPLLSFPSRCVCVSPCACPPPRQKALGARVPELRAANMELASESGERGRQLEATRALFTKTRDQLRVDQSALESLKAVNRRLVDELKAAQV